MTATSSTRLVHVRIPTGHELLDGDLSIPPGARGLVIFAHGSGSSRHSPRNQQVADALHLADLGTLLLDLLTPAEEQVDRLTAHLRFDIPMLARRLICAIDWAAGDPRTNGMRIGLFGASTGAAAALVGAADRSGLVRAVVSRGGRPDLAGEAIARVQAPTLLIIGSRDLPVIEVNREAASGMTCRHEIAIVPGATHLFEESGTLDQVSMLASRWFTQHLTGKLAPTA